MDGSYRSNKRNADDADQSRDQIKISFFLILFIRAEILFRGNSPSRTRERRVLSEPDA